MRDPGINRPHMWLTRENAIPDAVSPGKFAKANGVWEQGDTVRRQF